MLKRVTVSDRAAAPLTTTQYTPPADPAWNGRTKTAAFFDLDKTVIAKSSTLAFSKPFFDQGLINRRAVLKSSYAQFLFLMSGADHDQMDRMRSYLTNMCTGWDVEQVKSIVGGDVARHRRPVGVRRSRRSDRRPQAVRPRRGRGLGVRRGDRGADRPRIGRHPRDGHQDGRRGRQIHRGGRVLLLRRRKGAGHPASSPPARDIRSSTATPTPTRSPTCRCWRPSATRRR